VENYPGFPGGIEGPQLVELFCRHLESVGGTVTKAAVNMLRPKGDGRFIASSSIGEFTARAVIIATGTKARRIELPGMTKLEGRTVFYHLIELLAQMKNGEEIVIYGGGECRLRSGDRSPKKGTPGHRAEPIETALLTIAVGKGIGDRRKNDRRAVDKNGE